MILSKINTADNASYFENRVTLTRAGAPLLYAYNASTFLRRLKGLHGVPPLGPTDALILKPCRAIHSYGLERPIDVMFMSRTGIILKLQTVEPKRVLFCLRAHFVVEMAQGTAARLTLKSGQQFLVNGAEWS